MKKSTVHSMLRVFAVVLGISVASQASARHFRAYDASDYKLVKVEMAPVTSVFGTFNTSSTSYIGMLRVPVSPAMQPILMDGGDHDGDRGDTDDGDDTLG